MAMDNLSKFGVQSHSILKSESGGYFHFQVLPVTFDKGSFPPTPHQHLFPKRCVTKSVRPQVVPGNSVTRALQKTAIVLFEVFHQLMRLHLEVTPLQQLRIVMPMAKGCQGMARDAKGSAAGNNGKKLEKKNAPAIRDC